jgi:hypothetical protein
MTCHPYPLHCTVIVEERLCVPASEAFHTLACLPGGRIHIVEAEDEPVLRRVEEQRVAFAAVYLRTPRGVGACHCQVVGAPACELPCSSRAVVSRNHHSAPGNASSAHIAHPARPCWVPAWRITKSGF